MTGCALARACFVACRLGELSQHSVAPHSWHVRRCTHRAPTFTHSSHCRRTGCRISVMASMCVHATALMRAAGDTAKIKLLVNKGAIVNARSALGNTPLILAARANPSAEAVKFLIEHGADVNATNSFGGSAIQTAAAGGDIETVRILIKNGADVNAHSRGADPAVLWGGGRSPLGWAGSSVITVANLLYAADNRRFRDVLAYASG